MEILFYHDKFLHGNIFPSKEISQSNPLPPQREKWKIPWKKNTDPSSVIYKIPLFCR